MAEGSAYADLVYATTNSTVKVVDSTTDTIVATIPLAAQSKLTASPNGSIVYVGNGGSGTNVTVIDTASNTILTTIPTGTRPKDIAFTSDGTRAYVGNELSVDVTVVDTGTHTPLTTLAVPLNGSTPCPPESIAVTPDDSTAYLGVSQCNPYAIDTGTDAFTALTGGSSFAKGGSAISNDGSRYFVGYSAEVRVFDTTTNTLITPFSIPDLDNTEMAMASDGTRLYVSRNTPSAVSAFDIVPGSPTLYQEIATIALSTSTVLSTDIAITEDGKKGYVAQRGGVLAVIDTDPGSPNYHTLIGEIVLATADDVWGVTTAAVAMPSCVDNDGDGYGSPASATCPSGPDEDCDDLDASTFPGASELCDGLDNDCDGAVPSNEGDGDGDTFRVCDNDCEDADPNINPGALELPGNATDENCDGSLGSCDPFADWRNHGQFVRCVAHEVNALRDAGLISDDDGDDLVSSAAQSEVGN